MGALCGARVLTDLFDEERDWAHIEARLADGAPLRQARDWKGIEVYSMAMSAYFRLALCLLLFQTASPVRVSRSFHWNWRNSQELIAVAQSLRDAKASESEKKAIAAAIEEQIRANMADFEIDSESQLEKAALDTRVKMIDLNRDGTSEVVAQAMVGCGATGNCSLWIFQKTAHGYKLLLDGFGQTFTIQRASTKGFRDIVVAEHDSAFESGLTVYRYKDGQYRDGLVTTQTGRHSKTGLFIN